MVSCSFSVHISKLTGKRHLRVFHFQELNDVRIDLGIKDEDVNPMRFKQLHRHFASCGSHQQHWRRVHEKRSGAVDDINRFWNLFRLLRRPQVAI